MFLTTFLSNAQNITFSAGIDVPIQHYLGVNLETKNIDLYYRTGVLIPPFSNTILKILKKLGTEEIYINLLDASFDFGWMNSIGASYKFGNNKRWYFGSEVRFDYLSAADTPEDLLEAAIEKPVNIYRTKKNKIELGLNMFATGFRFGRLFNIDKQNRHYFRIEILFSKYVSTQSFLRINDKYPERLNNELNKILWQDVFKNYGYAGGIGFAYSFKI
jgi:hypothetical protein